jgi:hypothetical protein
VDETLTEGEGDGDGRNPGFMGCECVSEIGWGELIDLETLFS